MAGGGKVKLSEKNNHQPRGKLQMSRLHSPGLGLLVLLLSPLATSLAAHADLVPTTARVELPATSATSRLKPNTVVPNEVLVKFGNTLSVQSMAPTLHAMASEVKAINQTGLTLVKLTPGTETISSAMANLRTMPGVISVQPNFIYHSTALPNDPKIGQQWALKNTGQLISNENYSTDNPGTPGDDIDAEDAWQYQSDCSSVTVAVIDSGINYTQKDLVNSMWNGGTAYPHHGYDFVDNDNDPYPNRGDDSHATHVAGIIGAEGNNGTEGSGVCQKANIMSVRVLGTSGGTTASVIQGIDFAVDHGAKIINMSLSGSGGFDQAFSDAISYAQSKGVLVVVAAGNGDASGKGQDNDQIPVYPCNFTQDNLICVAALDQAFQLASFSNYGASNVDVGAPGTNILSTIAGPSQTSNFSGWTAKMGSGTGWFYGTTSTGIPLLVNPRNYGNDKYATNVDDRIWSSFVFGPDTQHVSLNYYMQGTMASGDYLNSGVVVGNNQDPFAGSGSRLQHATGTLSSPESAYPIDQCVNTTCSIGFQLSSSSTSPGDTGPLIAFLNLNTVANNTNAMGIESGTSMATPIVSGIAALLMSSEPDLSYQRIAQAIESSGTPEPSLSGVTTSGKAVNAMRALANLHIGVSGLTDQTATSGQPLSVTFTINGLGALHVSASSSNTQVLPNSGITGQSSCTQAGSCTLQIQPSSAGTSSIYVTVDDDYGQQAAGSLLLNVLTPPEPPSSGGGGGMNWIFLLIAGGILGSTRLLRMKRNHE
jgi:thermitase